MIPLGSDGFTTTGDARLKRIITPVTVCGCDHERRTCCSGPSVPAKAMWNTAIRQTAVSRRLIDLLRVAPIPFLRIDSSSAYLVNLHFTDMVIMPALPVAVMGRGSDDSCDVVVGMDVIGLGEFSITVIGGESTVSFRLRRRLS